MPRIQGTLHLSPSGAAKVAATFNRHNLPATPEQLIARGANPFMVWTRARIMQTDDIARFMQAPRMLAQNIQEGDYRGLTQEHVERFCDHLNIMPDKLAGSAPMGEAIAGAVIRQAREGASLLAREEAIYTLRQHRCMVEGQIEYERIDQEKLDYSGAVVGFLDTMASRAGLIVSGHREPRELYDSFVENLRGDIEALVDGAPIDSKHEKEIRRDFSEATWRLYGHPQCVAARKNLRACATGALNDKTGMTGWEALSEIVRADPEVLGPMAWDDDQPPVFVNGKFLRASGAVDLMLHSMREILMLEAREQDYNREYELMDLQLDALKTWGASPKGKRIMALWRDWQAVTKVLGYEQYHRTGPVKALPYLPNS